MAKYRKPRRCTIAMWFMAVSTGTLCGLGGCQTRVKEAVVAGTQDFVAALLSPENALELLANLDD